MNSFAHRTSRNRDSQRGAVLIVSLVFMLILTIISIASMQTATLQERMAGNMKENTIAFQSAEAALRTAEAVLRSGILPGFDGTGGFYQSCPDPADTRDACKYPAWADYDSAGWLSLSDKIPDVAKQPEYIIQQLNRAGNKNEVLDSDRPVSRDGFYRVIARGFGYSDRSMVVLATTFKRQEL
ncbi:MAG: PilX N-terminal domain-containing pilus assembly protein [Zhongshania sp.]|uniref:pilus assembly PilX family protein n=1 Tax=Zhongshania sp. TaxID=1971902 RepID=UPI0026042F0F|nr:PilX N-terminal domain-containing pilus assembly protein [Zhongshania sp.]MDF1691176.1 PilX N-terminal domain-containing pilus assembly protein [Zhongshania sp.]